MKKLMKHSKKIMFLIDVIVIAIAAVISNLLLCQEDKMFLSENIHTMMNSIISAIIVYEFYLNIFKTYRNITRFEEGKDYLNYIGICVMAGSTLAIIKIISNIITNIN